MANHQSLLKNSQPSVAVLLAAFNGLQWLPEQLESILHQLDVRVTIFISVDKSSDGTEKWCDALVEQDSRIRVLPHGKIFGGAAPNFFRLIGEVDFSTFDFISLADQDDIWLPNKLARAIKILQTVNAQAYSSNVIAFWPNGKKAWINKSQPQVKWDFLFEAAGPGCTYVFTNPFALALQQRVLGQSGSVGKIGLHDWFIYAFARAFNRKWVIDTEALMLYRQHGGNQVGTNKGLKALIHRSKKVLSGWAFDQSRLIAYLNGLSEDSFVKSHLNGSRLSFLLLGLRSRQCRRRGCDQVIFFLICFLLAVLGRRNQ